VALARAGLGDLAGADGSMVAIGAQAMART
jgi:hypothetical protein